MTVTVYQGDCRDNLRLLVPDRSVQCVVTSPPYFGLRSYGVGAENGEMGLEPTPDEYVAALVDVFRCVRDVLRDNGVVWLNLGDTFSRDPKKGNRSEYLGLHKNLKDSGCHTASQERTLAGLKPKNLIGIPWRVAFALQADGWYLRQDIVWCLSGGASVYARTQKGDMPMAIKDLVRLRPETVQLWNGVKWTQVLGWSRSAVSAGALEIELRSGERIGCTREHQWPTKRGLLRAGKLKVGDVIDTTRLPEPESPKDAAALGLDVAWLCGLYLAEGSMSNGRIQLAGHADETKQRLTRIESVASAFHGAVRVHLTGNTANIVISGPVIAAVVRVYVHGERASNKGMKVRVWQRSDAWLLAFLQGYLAGDGHYDKKNDRWRLGFTRNDRLADDFRTLAARLGLPLRLTPTTAMGFGRGWPVYRGDIRLTRTTHPNARVDAEIVAVRASRARQFWDIGVADDPHVFALASGVLTHNSKPNPMPESVTDRCTKSHEFIFLLTKKPKYYYDADAIKEPYSDSYAKDRRHGSVGLSHVLSKDYAGQGKAVQTPTQLHDSMFTKPIGRGRNKRDVWTVTTKPFRGAHFATFPIDLITPCILAGSRPGDLILDPFGGAGTVGVAAKRLGRDAVLCELNPEYCAMAEKRIAEDKG